MKHALGLVLGLLFLAGCETTKMQQMLFVEQEFDAYSAKGTGRIIGEAFAKTKGGDVKLAAGLPVILVPRTAYTEERFQFMMRGEDPPPADPGLRRYMRQSIANSQGKFGFRDLPPGEYLVYCRVTWQMPSGWETGGYLLARVRVAEGKTVGPVILRSGKAL